MAGAVERVRAALRHRLIAAPVTPRDSDGRLLPDDLQRYAAALCAGVDAVCVWAHTGRGLELPAADRARVLAAFRSATTAPVLAAVGVPDAAGFDAELAATLRMAEQAAAGGADALMVYPVPGLADPDHRTARTLRLHDAIAAATGLPVLGFLLYPEAGGVGYDTALLADLAARPGVAGVKVATLYDAIACQDAITAIRAAGALAITGEDRMFGPSLTWGAEAALVGVAAAAAAVSVAPLRRWYAGDSAGFLAASAVLDRFAAAIFRAPMDGYVQRMLWVAEAEGMLSAAAAYDPGGARLAAAERDAVRAAYRAAVDQPSRTR